MVAAIFAEAVAPLEEQAEFGGQLVDHVVGLGAFGGRVDIGAADLDLGGCAEAMILPDGLISVQAHIDAEDVGIVPQEDGEFLANRLLQRGR